MQFIAPCALDHGAHLSMRHRGHTFPVMLCCCHRVQFVLSGCWPLKRDNKQKVTHSYLYFSTLYVDFPSFFLFFIFLLLFFETRYLFIFLFLAVAKNRLILSFFVSPSLLKPLQQEARDCYHNTNMHTRRHAASATPLSLEI